jgi:probable rRNA maturation factor
MRIDLPLTRRTVNAILGALALSRAEVSILLLDDAGMTGLNEQYLKKKGPTDVISFPMQDGAFPGVQPQLLGDIAISLETAQRQADRRGVSLHEEVTALLVHGMLHLIGYDHELSPADSRRMKAKERAVLAQVAQSV